MDKLAPYIVENPWKAIGFAFAAGALLGTRFPGSGLVWKGIRFFAYRELKQAAMPMFNQMLDGKPAEPSWSTASS